MDTITNDILLAENIFVSVGAKGILHGAVIRAERGSITGLLGRNGSGKSTLLNTLYGVRGAADRTISVNGKIIKQPYLVKDLVSYLPQKPFLPGDIKAGSIIKTFGIEEDHMLSVFPELKEDLKIRVADLSGGRERLWSVLAILLSPTRFSLLDEPFSHIMPLHVERLEKLLLAQKLKKGIIITDHMYRPLLSVSDSIYLMKEGRSILIRDVQDLVLYGYVGQLSQL